MLKIANLCNNGSLNYANLVWYLKREDSIHLKGKGCFSEHRENLKREENQLFSSSHHTASASYFPISLSNFCTHT